LRGKKLKVSIITVVLNNKDTIEAAIKSVLGQTYQDIEYIVIDGNSTDGTKGIVNKYKDQINKFISEKDKGLYDALNKGIKNSTGDIIAILHSDDLFYDNYVVSDMVSKISASNAEICFSDMVIVSASSGRVLRYYMASYFNRWMFRMGWMPPHPTCFIKKSLFNEFGYYSLKYKIASDFDFLVRVFYGREIKWDYLNRVTVKMRQGGISNSGLVSKKRIASEINQVLHANRVWSYSFFQIGRYFIRAIELVIRPKKGDSIK
jgi:glycosyltransferase involved in cell wall biosynthesis